MGSIPAQEQGAVNLELNIDSSHLTMSWEPTGLRLFFIRKLTFTLERCFNSSHCNFYSLLYM